jgi:hypothetical protein
MPRTPPDWTKTGTVAGYADSVDPVCAPEDAQRLVEEYVPRLAEKVHVARKEKKAARLEHERVPE